MDFMCNLNKSVILNIPFGNVKISTKEYQIFFS